MEQTDQMAPQDSLLAAGAESPALVPIELVRPSPFRVRLVHRGNQISTHGAGNSIQETTALQSTDQDECIPPAFVHTRSLQRAAHGRGHGGINAVRRRKHGH